MPISSIPESHREVRLARRPGTVLSPDDFIVTEVPMPEPGPGQLVVRNVMMGVSAVLRTLMNEQSGLPIPSFEIGQVLAGPAIGEVATAPGGGQLRAGDLVSHWQGFREYAAVDAGGVQPVDVNTFPDLVAHLSMGATAWVAVNRGAEVRDGDTVFVSGAAGSLGSLAGQFARHCGADRIIGSTSTGSKARYLIDHLGYDAVVLRGAGPIEEQLRQAAPDGIDAVVDTAGGDQLQAALALARPGARFGLVGSLSSQVHGRVGAPIEIDAFALIAKAVTVRGVDFSRHLDLIGEYTTVFGQGLRDGTMSLPSTHLSGIEQAPRALIELLEGRHIGTVVVDL